MAPDDAGVAPGTFTRAWCAAVTAFFHEGEPRLASFLSLYDEGVRFQDPLRTVTGLGAFADMNRRFLRRSRAVDLDFGDTVEGPGFSFAAWTMRVSPRVGPSVQVEGITHLTLAAGRIIAHRDVFDLCGSVADALPGAGWLYRALAGTVG